MGIECEKSLHAIDQEEFHRIDKAIMRISFDIHNQMGRLLDERIYQDELAERARKVGFNVSREIQIRASFAHFRKDYSMDMLVNHGAIYELKATEDLTPNHEQQLINYLLLTNLQHGKLINFRKSSVESRFVSSRLTRKTRFDYTIEDNTWDKRQDLLRDTIRALLDEWGSCLDISLYRSAILHIIKGPTSGVFPVEIHSKGRVVGTQKMCLLDSSNAWHLSTILGDSKYYEIHLRRLINHCSIEKIHWINLNHRKITLKSLA